MNTQYSDRLNKKFFLENSTLDIDLSQSHLNYLKVKALKSRATAFLTAFKCGDGHLSSSLSMIEIMVAILEYSNNHPSKHVLSKGHGALGLYSVYSEFEVIDKKLLLNYGDSTSILTSHPNRKLINEIELSSGSLGMGLGFAVGMSFANSLNKSSESIFVILGDGECNEGSVWESALIAPSINLNNLTLIVDHNKIQAVANTSEIYGDLSLSHKFESFGWETYEVDGHDILQLLQVFSVKSNKPKAIIAHTTGEKSFPYDFNSVLWHYRRPDNDDLTQFIRKHSLNTLAPEILEFFT